jgi:hypothetical protein
MDTSGRGGLWARRAGEVAGEDVVEIAAYIAALGVPLNLGGTDTEVAEKPRQAVRGQGTACDIFLPRP